MVQAVPEGYHTVTPYLMFSGAGEAIRVLQESARRLRSDTPGRSQRQDPPRRDQDRRFLHHAR